MKKPLPHLATDKQAEEFVAHADLSTYNLSALQSAQFEFQAKDQRINMRLPAHLLRAVKQAAAQAHLPYQRFIRQTLERAVSNAPPQKTPLPPAGEGGAQPTRLGG